jgi:hypothetical protein
VAVRNAAGELVELLVSDNAQEWRWVGEDGVEKTVTEQELIAELSSESLPNYTLVWRKGWLEWLPAMQISELSWALPAGKSDEAVRPREQGAAAQPPAPPLYRYPVLKRRAANLRSDGPLARGPAAAPRPGPKKSPSAPPVGVTQAEPPTLAAEDPDNRTEPQQPRPSSPASLLSLEGPTLVGSRPFEEEVDMDSIEASNPAAAEDLTLDLDDDDDDDARDGAAAAGEAFGALAPARGAFAARAYGEEDDADTRVIPSRPPPPLGPLYVGPHAPPTSERPPPSYEPTEIKGPGRAYDEEDEEIPHIPPPPAAPMDLAAYAGTSRERGGPLPSNQKGLYLTVVGTVALAAVVGVLLFRGGADSDSSVASPSSSAASSPSGTNTTASVAATLAVASTPAPAPVAVAPKAAAEPPQGPGCTIVTAATRIADWAEPAITPSFAAIPGSERIAVGFGQSDTYAIGITIDSRTLDRDQVFREFRKQKLVSVVPTTDQDKLHFQVVRAGGALDNARAVDARPPFLLGTTSSGIERVVGKNEPERLWAFAASDGVTIPRVATLPGFGHAVTIRRGGQTGRIAAGWLEPSGRKRKELVDVRADGSFVGTPTISASDDRILIAFASRAEEGKDWSVQLATAKAGELPHAATRFEPPPGGPGGSAISPSAAALPGNRWLLQWTEGSTGNRVVRAQALSKDLAPVSQPVNLSPDGANAGQGVVLAHRDAGAVLFYVQNEKKSHELWGATIDCPE